MKKKLIALALAGLVSLTAAGCSDGGETKKSYAVPIYDDDKEISIGIWNGSFIYLKGSHIADLADAGINLLVGHYDVTTEFLDTCAARNVSVIPDERSWNGEVPKYYSHSAVKGLCVSDEPTAGEFDTLAQKHTLWKQTMGDKLFYVNLFPSYANSGALGGSLDSYVSNYINKVRPEVLSYDYYPLLKNADDPEVNILRETYFSDIDVYAHYAKQADIPLWYSVQTAAHQSYAAPTVAELRWQMAVAMTYGSKALLHYVYSSHESGYEPMVTMQGEKTEVFDKVKTANSEILAWDHIYMSFDWLGTAAILGDESSENWMFNLLQYGLDSSDVEGISDVTSDKDVLLGTFEDGDGNKGFMLTNATNPTENKNANVKVTFSSQYKGVLVIDDGKEEIVDLKNGAATIALEAGDGKFLIPLKTK